MEQANSVSENDCKTWDFFWLQVWNNWSRSVYSVRSEYTSQLWIVEMRSGCRMSEILPRSLCKVIHSPKICSLLLKLVIVRPIEYLHPTSSSKALLVIAFLIQRWRGLIMRIAVETLSASHFRSTVIKECRDIKFSTNKIYIHEMEVCMFSFSLSLPRALQPKTRFLINP